MGELTKKEIEEGVKKFIKRVPFSLSEDGRWLFDSERFVFGDGKVFDTRLRKWVNPSFPGGVQSDSIPLEKKKLSES